MFPGEADWWICWPCTRNTTLNPKDIIDMKIFGSFIIKLFGSRKFLFPLSSCNNHLWVLGFFCKIFGRGRSEVFLRKGVLKTCSKFTRGHPCRSTISIKLLATSAWVFSCKFAAYFQNTLRTPLDDCFWIFDLYTLHTS